VNIDIFHETVLPITGFKLFFNFHSLRIAIIYASILAFCQVLLNEYDDDDDDLHSSSSSLRYENLTYIEQPHTCKCTLGAFIYHKS